MIIMIDKHEIRRRAIEKLLGESKSLKEFSEKLEQTFEVEKIETWSTREPEKATTMVIRITLEDLPRAIRLELNARNKIDDLLEKLMNDN